MSLSILAIGTLFVCLFTPKHSRIYFLCVVILISPAAEYRKELIQRQEGIKAKSLYLQKDARNPALVF